MSEIQPEPVNDKLRPCYCFLWHEDRQLLEKEGLPYGYCGWCGCGKLGHTRHAPTGPSTAAWCDECWEREIHTKA